MMPWSENAWGTHLGLLVLHASPSHIFPIRANAVAAPALPYPMIATHTSATTIRNFEKRFTTHRYWRTPHAPGWGRGVWGPGALSLLGYKFGMPRVLRVHFLLVNLKHRVGIRSWEGKSGVTGVPSYLGFPALPKKEPSSSSLWVALLVIQLFY